jgi:hypothetical protein
METSPAALARAYCAAKNRRDGAAALRGPLGTLPPTGGTARLPVCSVFTTRDGLLAAERFFFDLHGLCTQLGVALPDVDAALAPFRAAVAEA